MKKDEIRARGLVIESMPNALFKIKAENGKEIRGYMSGKMKMHRISVFVGDYVEYVVDTQGENNRIVKRL